MNYISDRYNLGDSLFTCTLNQVRQYIPTQFLLSDRFNGFWHVVSGGKLVKTCQKTCYQWSELWDLSQNSGKVLTAFRPLGQEKKSVLWSGRRLPFYYADNIQFFSSLLTVRFHWVASDTFKACQWFTNLANVFNVNNIYRLYLTSKLEKAHCHNHYLKCVPRRCSSPRLFDRLNTMFAMGKIHSQARVPCTPCYRVR